jgi:uncharacterized membrane protein (DUF4010 family)
MDIGDFLDQGNGLQHVPAFLISLAIGLLIGLERERSPVAKAGLRTFALTALLGTLSAMLADRAGSPWILVAGFAVVASIIVSAYLEDRKLEDPGTTTEAALVLCFGLGAMVWYGETTLAVMLGIVTTILLHYKPELQNLSKSLSRTDIKSVLQFAVLSFIVLPVLPDRDFGPYNALNLNQIWVMVVLISGVSLAGYAALRIVGQRYGAPLLGVFGGIASSTATTLVYARHGKGGEKFARLAAVVILIASLVVLIRLAVLGSVVSPRIVVYLLPVLAGGLVLGGAVTYWLWRKISRAGELPMPEITNPTELKVSLSFGLLYAVVLVAAAWLSDYAGSGGLYALALISGLTDVDAITLSSLRLFEQGKLDPLQTVSAITIAYISNMGFKLGLVAVVGGMTLARLCLPAVIAVVAGLGGGWALHFLL